MSNILVGVTGWGDHHLLYPAGTRPSDKLQLYAGHFPIVEVDASFYAIQPKRNYESWVRQTPDKFQFIVKAYQSMTGHKRRDEREEKNAEELLADFRSSIQPLVEAGKLGMVLFQFPPWVDCQKKYVKYIRKCRRFYEDLPFAVEFRHKSWFTPRFKDATLEFFQKEDIIHVVCDEPQIGDGCVPIVPAVTFPPKTLVRFHGRNRAGWLNSGQPNWRDVRYHYRYNEAELNEWAVRIEQLAAQAEQVYILFNNNSQGDAVPNARELINLLGVQYDNLAPRQMEWI